MKKFYLLSLVLFAFLFAGCSDDDDKQKDNISGEYTGKNLTFSLNGAEKTDATVNFKTADLANGEFVIKNLIPGESEITVAGVQLLQDEKNAEVYNFSGESKNTYREVTFTGTVGSGTMKMDTKVKIVSAVANRWTPKGTPAIALNITPSSEDAKMNMHGFGGKNNQEVLITDGFKSTANLLSTMFLLILDVNIDLKDNTNLIAEWGGKGMAANLIPSGQSEEGVVKYNVGQDKLYVSIDIKNLIGQFVGGGLPSGMTLEQMMEMVTTLLQGIPVEYRYYINDKEVPCLEATFTKELLAPYLKVLIPVLMDKLQDAEIPNIPLINISKESLLGYLPEFARAIEESKDFSLVLTLQPNPKK